MKKKQKQIKPKKVKASIRKKTSFTQKIHKIKEPVEQIAPITVVQEIVKKVRGRKKAASKMYFTESTEDYIDLFNKTDCVKERERIFEQHIKYPFEKLIENVFNTFKFSYFETGSMDVQKETLSHLVANIAKYEKQKGRAFAYFSIIAKHYLIFLNNTNYKRFNQTVEIGEDREENTVQLQVVDKYHKNCEMSEFMSLMIKYWENNINKIFSKQRDLNIANAVIELFRNADRIDAFNKKALYLYIREISNCKTQQITKVINKMKLCHLNINRSYLNDGVINN